MAIEFKPDSQRAPSPTFALLDKEFEVGDTVTLARLDNSLERKLITKKEYDVLHRKITKRLEVVEAGLVSATKTQAEQIEELGLDEVTGLQRLKKLKPKIEQMLRELNSPNPPYAVVIIKVDLDNLKQWNDEYGWDKGSQALKMVAEALQSNIKDTDNAYRMGDQSDEMVAVLRLSNDLPSKRIEDIKKAINSGFIMSPEGKLPVTAALGYTVLTPGSKKKPDQVLKKVDIEFSKDKHDKRVKNSRIREAKKRIEKVA